MSKQTRVNMATALATMDHTPAQRERFIIDLGVDVWIAAYLDLAMGHSLQASQKQTDQMAAEILKHGPFSDSLGVPAWLYRLALNCCPLSADEWEDDEVKWFTRPDPDLISPQLLSKWVKVLLDFCEKEFNEMSSRTSRVPTAIESRVRSVDKRGLVELAMEIATNDSLSQRQRNSYRKAVGDKAWTAAYLELVIGPEVAPSQKHIDRMKNELLAVRMNNDHLQETLGVPYWLFLISCGCSPVPARGWIGELKKNDFSVVPDPSLVTPQIFKLWVEELVRQMAPDAIHEGKALCNDQEGPYTQEEYCDSLNWLLHLGFADSLPPQYANSLAVIKEASDDAFTNALIGNSMY